MKIIEFYQTKVGKEPCREWLDSFDGVIRRKILAYITRIAGGAAKKSIRALGDGIFEIKIDHGPGFRVYFSEIGNVLILLLVGDDKHSQFRYIQQAKDYRRTYKKK